LSVLLVLPSSHCSPASTTPSPHRGTVQSFRQLSVLFVLPSSHCSPVSTMPSPHLGTVQLFRQLSALLVLPSSQDSPESRFPSPQTVQLPRQVLPFAPPGCPGGSQVSPVVFPTMLSPQYRTGLQIG